MLLNNNVSGSLYKSLISALVALDHPKFIIVFQSLNINISQRDLDNSTVLPDGFDKLIVLHVDTTVM